MGGRGGAAGLCLLLAALQPPGGGGDAWWGPPGSGWGDGGGAEEPPSPPSPSAPPPRLSCIRRDPRGGMNCSWGGGAAPPGPLELRYRSVFLGGFGGARRVPPGRGWALVPRGELTAGDVYSVGLHGAGGARLGPPLNVSLDHIVKPPPPQLLVNVTPPASVRWLWPPNWGGGIGGAPPPRCALRLRPYGHSAWTTVPDADLEPEGYELGGLAPGVPHQLQGRCLGEGGGLWSDWSPPRSFVLPGGALQEPLAAWRRVEELEGGARGLVLLWKDPSAGGGRSYAVTAELRRGPPRLLRPPCCRCPLPPGTVGTSLTAWGPPGPTAPARLRFDRTDLPPPRGLRVQPAPGLALWVWWEHDPPPAPPAGPPPPAPSHVVEWEEVGAGGGAPPEWLRCPPGTHSALIKGPLRGGRRYLVRVHSLYPGGSGAAEAEAVVRESGPPAPSPLVPVLCGAVAAAAAAVLAQGLRLRCRRCWEPVPNPGRSRAAQMGGTGGGTGGGPDPAPGPEEPPLLLTVLGTGTGTGTGTDAGGCPGAPPGGSGYERHFLPTPEELLGWGPPAGTPPGTPGDAGGHGEDTGGHGGDTGGRGTHTGTRGGDTELHGGDMGTRGGDTGPHGGDTGTRGGDTGTPGATTGPPGGDLGTRS